MLAATAGDAHGFRVGVLSLSLFFVCWSGSRADHAVRFIDHTRHVSGTNHSMPLTRELAYFF